MAKKTKRGWKQERERISKQEHEIAYEARKTKKSRAAVRAARKAVGSSRKKVRAYG